MTMALTITWDVTQIVQATFLDGTVMAIMQLSVMKSVEMDLLSVLKIVMTNLMMTLDVNLDVSLDLLIFMNAQ